MADEILRREALARVRRLVLAARTVARDPELPPLMARATGLSLEGVHVALARCLETHPSDAELERLIEGASPAPRVHVILSANVFTAPLRALAVACAASSEVSVKPSRRDPVFTRALVREAPDLRIAIDEGTDLSSIVEGEVHVYGKDETVAAVRCVVPREVRVRAHGAGLGVAFVTRGAALDDAARGLADDVAVFDQRGCLSPRVVLVEGDASRGALLVRALGARLTELGRSMPRGSLDPSERSAGVLYAEAMAFAGQVWRGDDWTIGLSPAGTSLLVPPVGRHVHVATVGGVGEASRLLDAVERWVVAVGADDLSVAGRLVRDVHRVRLSLLGEMQRPPLDGPVDLR